jgi:hypothetical protein
MTRAQVEKFATRTKAVFAAYFGPPPVETTETKIRELKDGVEYWKSELRFAKESLGIFRAKLRALRKKAKRAKRKASRK